MLTEQDLTTVDSSQETVRKPSKPSSAYTMRFAPPVACNIEQLLQWAYGKQQVHLRLRERERNGLSVSTGGYDSVVKVQMNAIHGGRISGGGMPPGLPPMLDEMAAEEIHPDALTIHATLAIMDALSVGLVIKHAYECSRPDWGGPLEPLQPLRKGTGKVVMMRDNSQHAIASQLDPVPLAYNETVQHLRAMYTHWWEALLILQDELQRQLPEMTIARSLAPEQPWRVRQT